MCSWSWFGVSHHVYARLYCVRTKLLGHLAPLALQEFSDIPFYICRYVTAITACTLLRFWSGCGKFCPLIQKSIYLDRYRLVLGGYVWFIISILQWSSGQGNFFQTLSKPCTYDSTTHCRLIQSKIFVNTYGMTRFLYINTICSCWINNQVIKWL